ncbi:MAG: hypothetical protein LUI06_02860 [Ruminococcus sp.]|nr:hypothetical protein [Ruminococcus sp.]
MINAMKEKRLFRYKLQKSWYKTLTQVDIIDCEKNNVRCLKIDNFIRLPRNVFPSAEGYITTISRKDIDEIKNIYNEHPNIFQFTEVEMPGILDGVSNCFEFYFERETEMHNEIEAYNMWYYENLNHSNSCADIPEKASEILKVYDEISSILKRNGVFDDYFALYLNRKE